MQSFREGDENIHRRSLAARGGSRVDGGRSPVAASSRGWDNVDSGRLTTVWLSFVGGFVDAAGAVCLFGLLPSHITANLVSIGSMHPLDASGSDGATLFRVALLPVFILSVVMTVVAAKVAHQWVGPRRTPIVLLGSMSLVFLTIWAVVLGLELPFDRHDDSGTRLLSLGVIAVMGVQNTLTRVSIWKLPPTTVMTGNTVQLLVDLVELGLAAPSEPPDEARREITQRLRKFSAPLLGFLVGATTGSILAASWGAAAFVVPAACAGMLSLHLWWHERADVLRCRGE